LCRLEKTNRDRCHGRRLHRAMNNRRNQGQVKRQGLTRGAPGELGG
jgi:hypothetical protein